MIRKSSCSELPCVREDGEARGLGLNLSLLGDLEHIILPKWFQNTFVQERWWCECTVNSYCEDK